MSTVSSRLNKIVCVYNRYYLLVAVLLSMNFSLFSQGKLPGNSAPAQNNQAMPRIGIDSISDIKRKAEDIRKAERITAGADYTVVNCTLYFSGAGFYQTAVAQISGNSLYTLKELTSRLVPGSVIGLDKVKVKDKNGKVREIPGLVITLL